MKVIIAGGGTAGHINPALTIADLLVKNLNMNKGDIIFIGTKRGLEKDLVPRADYDIKFINVKGLNKKISFDTIKGLFSLLIGMIQSRKIIKEFKPNIAIGTGGYVSGPVLYWASKFKIPTFIHESNAYPGITTKILAKKIDICAISFEESKKHLKDCKKIILTGNPLRDDILDLDRKTCRADLKIEKDEKLVVVMGGSLGALSINNAMVELINKHYKENDFRLIYAPGKQYYNEVINNIYSDFKGVEIKEYIYNSPQVYNSADLIVARGGSMTISEIMAIGIPSILIPSSNVAENHQENNARAIEKHGACEVLLDSQVNGEVLYNKIMGIIGNNKKCSIMKKNSYQIGIRDGKKRIIKILKEMMEEK